MTVTARAGMSLDELMERQRELLTRLREVDHWRRLVLARLDLVIAAVTDIDELSGGGRATAPPFGLRELVGIPPAAQALDDASALVPLREVLTELDRYRARLRREVVATSRQLAMRLGTEEEFAGKMACPTSQPATAHGKLFANPPTGVR